MALAYALAIAALLPAGSSQIRSLPTIVKPLRYPDYWYATAAFLERTVPGDERVAVFPWHLYQPLRVTEGRLAANPAPVFFPGLLTVPRNIEIPGRATEITSRYDRIGLAVGRDSELAVCSGTDATPPGDPLGPRPRRRGERRDDVGAACL